MFDSEDEGKKTEAGFKINRRFEKSFNERKTREDLDWAKTRYGKNMEYLGGEGSDSSLAEDEDAVLDDENVTLKILSTISKIRNKNPEIYDTSKAFFEEKDLKSGLSQLERGKMLGKRDAPMTYRKQIQQMVADVNAGEAMSEEDDIDPNDETPFEVQQRFKTEFKQAAAFDAGEHDDDLFRVKKKSKKQVEDEESEFKKFLKIHKLIDKTGAKDLKKAFGDKSNLDEGDQFLRKYILTKGWVELSDESDGGEEFKHVNGTKEGIDLNNQLDVADEEDELRDHEIEEFEEKINFRFERPGGTRVQTYERDIKETMRKKDETRAEKRKEREQRKKEEKEEFKSEIEHFKSLKKTELQAKIQKLVKAGGFTDLQKATNLQNLMGKDFNEVEYDNLMENVFNDEYYDDEDENEDELEKYIEDAEAKVDVAITGREREDGDEIKNEAPEDPELAPLTPTSNVPILMKKKMNKEEADAINSSLSNNLWWYCDSCGRGIQPLEHRFDCMECDDYTECKQCAELKGHDHKMKKFIIPEGCTPPPTDNIQQYLDQVIYCTKCSCKLDGSQVYFKSKEVADYILCETCMYFSKKHRNKKDFEQVEPTKMPLNAIIEKEDFHKLESLGVDPELTKMVDEYYGIDFEDVIAGGLKTRFKYMAIKGDDFNLDDGDLVFADDRILNRYLSVKKLAPYRQVEISDKHKKKMKKLISLVKASAEKNKQEVVKMIELDKEEEYLKTMSKKNQKYKKKLEKFYEKKTKMMKNQSARDRGEEEREKVKITDMTNAEEPMNLEETGISTSRLKTYNL